MTNDTFEVMKPGLATSVQDLGRTGFQQYGVVVSGAMDVYALQVANILVGNERGEACLEIAIMGPELRIMKNTVLAICGADLSPQLDGEDVPLWKSFHAEAGQRLTFGRPKTGAYAYIAVSGGIEVPIVMGSRSTYTDAQIGGFHGRNLEKGDRLKAKVANLSLKSIHRRGLMPNCVPTYETARKIRVVLGADKHAFKKESIATFLTEQYEVSGQSNRMGSRLLGPKLNHVNGADIISDAVFLGTIQVPANGEPIILLANRQTTGGYARIATVISVDLPYVAQKLPGDCLSFEAIHVADAQRLFIEQERFLRILTACARVF